MIDRKDELIEIVEGEFMVSVELNEEFFRKVYKNFYFEVEGILFWKCLFIGYVLFIWYFENFFYMIYIDLIVRDYKVLLIF